MRKRRYRRKSRWPVILILVLLLGFSWYAYQAVKPDMEHAMYPREYRDDYMNIFDKIRDTLKII